MKGPVVVLDAADAVGRGVVQAAIAAAWPVIAVSADAAALEELQRSHRGADLTVLRGSTADDAKSAALVVSLRKLDRPIAGVVVARCGDPQRGRVLDQSPDALRRALEDELFPQLCAARALLPLLVDAGRNGSYVLIGGPGGEQPWAGYGHRSITASAVRMLMRVLHNEMRSLAVRVQLLDVERPVRTDENDERACTQWPTALAIGERALALIDHASPGQVADAIVRYMPPSLPATRMRPPLEPRADTADRATTATPVLAAAVPRVARATVDAEVFLEDTWALLEPLLSTHRNEASRK